MKFLIHPPVTATHEGGDFDGKTITLPAAFRGVDVQEGEKAARYRFATRKPDGSYTYEFATRRRKLHQGAIAVPAGDGVKAVGLRFYPSTPKADEVGG